MTTATTVWQDRFSRYRGHKLMTRELGASIPPLYANEHVADYGTVVAVAKLFCPFNNWTWYVTEWDASTGYCFGVITGFETELGYFDLDDLAELTAPMFKNLPAIERDLDWKPTPLGEIKELAHKYGKETP